MLLCRFRFTSLRCLSRSHVFLARNTNTTNCISKYTTIPTPLSVTKTKVTNQITLRTVDSASDRSGDASVQTNRNVVIIFEWLYAKTPAIDKYCSLYHSLGLDVITVKGKVVHFLWPPTGYTFAEDLLNYILQDRKDNYFIHAFSVGAYIFTIMLMLAHGNPVKYGVFRERVIGQIFDSLAIGSYDNMSSGLVSPLPTTETMRKLILKLMNVYYNMTKKNTRDEYDRLVDHFKTNPITVPTLLYYSKDDPMCHVTSIEAMINKWQNDFSDFDVMSTWWDNSVHTAHLKFHEKDYLDSWKTLVEKVKLV